jgi:hypothetical protein
MSSAQEVLLTIRLFSSIAGGHLTEHARSLLQQILPELEGRDRETCLQLLGAEGSRLAREGAAIARQIQLYGGLAL